MYGLPLGCLKVEYKLLFLNQMNWWESYGKVVQKWRSIENVYYSASITGYLTGAKLCKWHDSKTYFSSNLTFRGQNRNANCLCRIIGSYIGIMPSRLHVIIRTNDTLVRVRPMEMNFSQIESKHNTFHTKKLNWKVVYRFGALIGSPLTHRSRGKIVISFCRRRIPVHFLEWKLLKFKQNVIEICSSVSNWQ